MNLTTARANGKKVFAIIDGKSVFYRGYYAMPNLATSDGRPTGGVYGFMTMALELVKQIKPDYVAVAWDKPKTNIRRRKAIYDGYKANRHPAPPDFYVQVPILEELLKFLPVTHKRIEKRKNKNLYECRFSVTDSAKLYHYMYNNSTV